MRREPGLLTPVADRRSQVADDLYDALVKQGASFWEHVYPMFLNRDITRVCDYFKRMGVKCDENRITYDLWEHYGEAQRSRLFDQSFDEEGNLLG